MTMNESPIGDAPRTTHLRRWLWTSALLNLFLVGGIAGGTWRWWAHQAEARSVATSTQTGTPTGAPAGSSPATARGLRFAADGLPPERRQAFRTGLREVRREAAALTQGSREGRAEVVRLLAAPQFDRAAVEAALARTRAADTAVRERVEAHVVDFAAQLTPAERQTLVQGLAAQQGPFHVPASPARR
ncbi:Uncharacterized membrane protein [Delftia acidovorans]|nr:Uncharacterized membrane protein [Delftia acidovorans]